MTPIDADQYEIRLTFEEHAGGVTPPEGTGWQLWTATAENGAVWFVWYRRRKGAARG